MYQYIIRIRSPAEVKYHKLFWTENQFSNFYQIDNSLKQFEKVKKWSNILISFITTHNSKVRIIRQNWFTATECENK